MAKRILWGVLAAVSALLVIRLGGLIYTVVIGLLSALSVFEYVSLLKKQNLRPQTEIILIFSLTLLVFIYWKYAFKPGVSMNTDRFFTIMLILVFFTTLALELLRGDPGQGLMNAAVNLFGTVYIGFMFAYILLLRFLPDGFFYLLYTLAVTWSNDSAAFFVGINFGKHKLFPRISPKKSIEGYMGGIIGGLVAAVILGIIFQRPLPPLLIISFFVVIAGQFGDLVESIIKRNAGVKDSGTFLPGHGGILDRLDSLLLAAPVVYFAIDYLSMFN
jgi:phosphatidate cytidylyltransferase